MVEYYLFTIIISVIYAANRRFAFYFAVIGVFYFLNVLPSTDADYDIYQEAFDNAYVISSYPWFTTSSILTAEPFYLWYTSFWGVLVPYGFPLFLGINFIVSFLLSIRMTLVLPKEHLFDYWLFMLPVIIPTLFYFSPRSSISFIALTICFYYFIRKSYIPAFATLIFAGLMHSQYLLMGFLIMLVAFTFNKVIESDRRFFFIWIYAIILFICLMTINAGKDFIASTLSFLPSSAIINSKLGYFENDNLLVGFRVSGVFSILVYPFLVWRLYKKVRVKNFKLIFSDESLEARFIFMFIAVIVFGAVINLAFINAPHIAGRLSRFSDYLGMTTLLPLYFRYCGRQELGFVVLFAICVFTPILYPTIYHNVSWNVF